MLHSFLYELSEEQFGFTDFHSNIGNAHHLKSLAISRMIANPRELSGHVTSTHNAKLKHEIAMEV